MNEHQFYRAINEKARELNLNPLLLISGIEGLYSFRDVQLNSINYPFLDNLILSILALRIGDSFHTIAEKNLVSLNNEIRKAAGTELRQLSREEIQSSPNVYLQAFANVLAGKTAIRKYHEKALDVAAIEVRKAQEHFKNASIGSIVLDICNDMKGNADFSFLFNK